MKVKDIIIYPIKSLGGISLDKALCQREGLAFDRRMMLVDSEGQFITQRNFPQLAMVGSAWFEEGFKFFDKATPSNHIFIPHQSKMSAEIEVQVWKHRFLASKVEGFDEWFSSRTGINTHLVKMTDNSTRIKSLIKAPRTTTLSMADGYPYLILSEQSLADLNRRLIVSVPMNRFRPNIVLSANIPYEEELVDKFTVGSTTFRMIKPCARCQMVNIDQKTSRKLVEPLKTLSSYKRKGNNVYFGMNAIILEDGYINIGDQIAKI